VNIIRTILEAALDVFSNSLAFVCAIVLIAVMWAILPIRNQIIKKSGYKYCRKCLGMGKIVECPFCEETGKIDWVSNVTRRSKDE
jgi:hypothetical protein